jgi:Uma2 family endonuclease
VREYWIVDPEEQYITTHTLKDGAYLAFPYGDTDTVPVAVLPGLEIDLAAIFKESGELTPPSSLLPPL